MEKCNLRVPVVSQYEGLLVIKDDIPSAKSKGCRDCEFAPEISQAMNFSEYIVEAFRYCENIELADAPKQYMFKDNVAEGKREVNKLSNTTALALLSTVSARGRDFVFSNAQAAAALAKLDVDRFQPSKIIRETNWAFNQGFLEKLSIRSLRIVYYRQSDDPRWENITGYPEVVGFTEKYLTEGS